MDERSLSLGRKRLLDRSGKQGATPPWIDGKAGNLHPEPSFGSGAKAPSPRGTAVPRSASAVWERGRLARPGAAKGRSSGLWPRLRTSLREMSDLQRLTWKP